MTDIEQRLRHAIQQAAQRGFANYTILTSRGDHMCPHPVTFHPKDGHGFEDERRWLGIEEDGTATVNDGDEYTDPIEALCRLFESLPEIVERDAITKT